MRDGMLPGSDWIRAFLCRLLCLILISLAASCGDGQISFTFQSTRTESPEDGSASFTIRWHSASDQQTPAGTIVSRAINDCSADGIATVRCDVYDDTGTFLATGGPWPCADRSGRIDNIPAGGNRRFIILGDDANGDIVYKGQTPAAITILPGGNTDVGVVDAFSYVPSGLQATGVSNRQIDLLWNATIENMGIAGYRIHRDSFEVATSASTSYSDTGLRPATQYCYTVTAHDDFGNASGHSAEVCAATTDNEPPVARITAPNDNAAFDQQTAVTFTGTGEDPEDGVLSGTTFTWTSHKDGRMGTGSSITIDSLSAGTHTITLSMTDSEGAPGTDEVTIIIRPIPPLLISPIQNEELDNGCNPYTDAIEWNFDWSDVPGATRYQIRVNGPYTTNPFIEREVNTSDHTFTDSNQFFDYPNLDEWQWQVRAGIPNGDWSGWSETGYFNLESLNTDCQAHQIFNIILDPPTPDTLKNGQQVYINFDYYTEAADGVRIFVRPFTNGELSPGYAAHASGIYPSGSGQGSGYFTITTGSVTVDQLRFQMWNPDQTQLLQSFFIDVSYQFL